MRRFLSVLFVITFLAVISLSGLAAEGSKVIKLTHVVNEQDAFHISALKFKEVVEENTDGNVVIEIHPNAELGDERTLLEGMQLGTIDMGVITNGQMPFLFGSPEEAYYILDGEIGQKVLEKLNNIQIHGLAYSERGFRNLTNSVRPVKSASDIEGLKIRLMESPLYVDTFKALGANAVPMAWTECLTGLSQGTIDGQENPVVVVYSFKLYESQDYMTMDRHTYAPATILISGQLWQSLTSEEQAIFEEAAKVAGQAARDYNNENEAEQLQFIKDQGMIVEEDPDLDTFRDAVKSVYEKYGPQFGSLLEEIQNALAEFRGQ